jgi:hypothetical protein
MNSTTTITTTTAAAPAINYNDKNNDEKQW